MYFIAIIQLNISKLLTWKISNTAFHQFCTGRSYFHFNWRWFDYSSPKKDNLDQMCSLPHQIFLKEPCWVRRRWRGRRVGQTASPCWDPSWRWRRRWPPRPPSLAPWSGMKKQALRSSCELLRLGKLNRLYSIACIWYAFKSCHKHCRPAISWQKDCMQSKRCQKHCLPVISCLRHCMLLIIYFDQFWSVLIWLDLTWSDLIWLDLTWSDLI